MSQLGWFRKHHAKTRETINGPFTLQSASFALNLEQYNGLGLISLIGSYRWGLELYYKTSRLYLTSSRQKLTMTFYSLYYQQNRTLKVNNIICQDKRWNHAIYAIYIIKKNKNRLFELPSLSWLIWALSKRTPRYLQSLQFQNLRRWKTVQPEDISRVKSI